MSKWDQCKAVYAAQGILLSRGYGDMDDRMQRVLYRLDQRMYELAPSVSVTPWARSKYTLNQQVYGMTANAENGEN